MIKNILNWFNKEDIYNIHEKSLKLLEEVGIKLDDREFLKKLSKHDVLIDKDKNIVRIPKRISEHFLNKIPKKIIFYGIDPKYDLVPGTGKIYRPISGTINITENYSEIRKPNTKDVENIARIIQNLDFINYNVAPVFPFDIPDKIMDIGTARICLMNCSKHFGVDSLNVNNFEVILEMAFKISGSEENFKKRPFLQVAFPPTSPLIFDKNACEIARTATKYNIPVRICSSPISGATGPITLSGNVLLMHTENIAGAIVIQMLNEGAPVFYSCAPTILDMKYATACWGAAEFAKMSACSAELAHFCGMYIDTKGFPTDSKLSDQQSAIEKAMNLLLSAVSGVDILSGAGLLEEELTFDVPQLIIDNEMAKYVENILRGIEISEEKLSYDLIKEIGIGGNYISSAQTLNLFRTEHEFTELLDRRSRGIWNNIKDKGIYEKAKTIAENIISERKAYALPDSVIGELDSIYEKEQNKIKKFN